MTAFALALGVAEGGCTSLIGDNFTFGNANGDAGGGTTTGGGDTTSDTGGGTDTTGGATSGGSDGGSDSGAPSTDIVVMPTSGLITSEAGRQDTFTIVLARRPTAAVFISLTSSAPGEGTVSPTSVVFTPDNWRSPQMVTVTGIDDTAPDGNQKYSIVTAPALSDDASYNGEDAADVGVINIDNETAGVTVIPTAGLLTSESGDSATFTVVLNSKPTANVTIALSSSKPTEGTVAPASLVFTSDDWMAPQLVTVTGVDDALKDGPQAYQIVTGATQSTDPSYNNVDVDDVSVVNIDNETAGFRIKLLTGVSADGKSLLTSEKGDMATFSIVLNAPPSADVTVALSSSNIGEGTVAPAKLTFTSANWMAPQVVTVSGVDDNFADGNVPYTIVTAKAKSGDADYDGLDPDDVAVTNIDNDSAGVTVKLLTGLSQDSQSLITSEDGTSATFSVVLNSKPSDTVTIPLASSVPKEGTVSPAKLTFTPANWNAPQTVTVTGVNDDVADGAQPYVVRTGAATSTDAQYSGLDAADVNVTNRDNDSPGLSVLLVSGVVGNMAGLVTDEGGGSASFTVALTSKPLANVTIGVASSQTKEGAVSPGSLTFTPDNYRAPQTVLVTGVDDAIADGDQPYRISLAAAVSTDTGYNGRFATQINVTNQDNDSPGIIVAPTTGLITSEKGDKATFTVKLKSQPTADVSIPLSSSNKNEGTVSPATLTFTSIDWNAPQTVTVTGAQDDGVADGDQLYRVVTGAATSNDANYKGVDPADVNVTNLDDDSPDVLVSPTTGLLTTEAGATAIFTVVLKSKPLAAVSLSLTSGNPAEGTVSPASLTFSPIDWNAPQTVTVKGVDDKIQDGPQPYTIITGAASSTDAKYNGINPPDVSVTNADDDSAGITVTPLTGIDPNVLPPRPAQLVTSEKGDTATFNIVLSTQPAANVTFIVQSSKTTEGTVAPGTVTFDASNWNKPQTETVTGVDDDVADGDQPFTVSISAASSTDPNYGGKFATQIVVTNQDNDKPGITVNPTTGLMTTEGGGTAKFTIKLKSQPAGGASVTIPIHSSVPTEGVPSSASVVLDSTNWNAGVEVTVTGQDDAIADGDQPYFIVTDASMSTDPKYNGLAVDDVSLVNADDDKPGVIVDQPASPITMEAGMTPVTFVIRLSSQPTSDVTIALHSDNTAEGVPSASSVTLNATNWKTGVAVTVTGQNDDVADGDQSYKIITDASVSDPMIDAVYNGLPVADVPLTNKDDDHAGIKVTPGVAGCAIAPGTTSTFTVQLTSQPAGKSTVTVPLSVNPAAEASLDMPSVTFDSSSWNTPVTVTVTGLDDGSMGTMNPVAFAVTIGMPSASPTADPVYAAIDPSPDSIMCTNTVPMPPPPPPPGP